MPFKDAFLFWLKLGFVSFGGPAGQIALMHDTLVTRRKVVSEARFLRALNFCMVLPGPEAQQLATTLGWLLHRTVGGLVAGGLFILPSFFILLGISELYVRYGETPAIAGLFWGIKPAVLALVLFASYRMGKNTLKEAWAWPVASASLLGTTLFHVSFPWLVLFALGVSFLGPRLAPRLFKAVPNETGQAHRPASQDQGPVSTHAPVRPIWVLIMGGLAWGLPMAALYFLLGPSHPLTTMGLFFSKAALLTFGGAYAVLPYVFDAAVNQYHWLTLPQMMDGLGLGETTPGPLIMVVTYIGFVGGYLNHVLSSPVPFWSGLAGALVATWFTFLPSFVFVLIGAPWIESAHRHFPLERPLRAITAAVVGVILALALQFGQSLLLVEGHLQLEALLLCVLALYLLIQRQSPPIPIILGFGLLGALVHGVLL